MQALDQNDDRRGVLILSPHPDDAALSIGGILHMDRLYPPVHLVTVFGRSNFLGDFGFQSDWKSVTRRRRAEDKAFAARVGVNLIYCDLPEASLRTDQSYDSIFASRRHPEVCMPREVVTTLMKVLRTARPAEILAPLGLGWHRDHLITRDIAALLSCESGARLSYYEDLPYAARLSHTEIQSYVDLVNQDLQPMMVGLGQYAKAKLESIGIYRSQISNKTTELIRRYALQLDPLIGAERLWILGDNDGSVALTPC